MWIQDPDTWFLKIDAINTKLKSINQNYEKKDYEMKAHLLGNLPSGYEDVKTKISGKEAEYSVRDIEREIAKKWKRDYGTDGANSSSQKLSNVAFNIEGKQQAARFHQEARREEGASGLVPRSSEASAGNVANKGTRQQSAEARGRYVLNVENLHVRNIMWYQEF